MQQDLENIGSRIREERRKRGLTQEKLSEMADISIQHMNRIENGVRKPSMDAVHRIADALGITVELLLGKSDDFKEFHKEISHLLSDCTEYEQNVLGELLVFAKMSMRKNRHLFDK